jgi:VanZ family protein
MHKFVTKYIKRYPLSTLCIVVIWGLSLTPFFPETPLNDVQFIDKWTHFIMYGGLCLVIGFEYYRHHRRQRPDYRRLILWGWLAPVLMSGLLELLQAYATTTRNGDWYDFAANTVGATLGAALSMLLVRFSPKA